MPGRSHLNRYIDYSDGVEAGGLEQEDELYGQPGDGEHEGDHRDEPHHPPLVVGALPADRHGTRGLHTPQSARGAIKGNIISDF